MKVLLNSSINLLSVSYVINNYITLLVIYKTDNSMIADSDSEFFSIPLLILQGQETDIQTTVLYIKTVLFIAHKKIIKISIDKNIFFH